MHSTIILLFSMCDPIQFMETKHAGSQIPTDYNISIFLLLSLVFCCNNRDTEALQLQADDKDWEEEQSL